MSTDAIWKNYEAQKSIYDAELQNLKKEYDHNSQKLGKNRDTALNEAYIGKKQAERDLPKLLSAMGMHGGLSETSSVRLKNSYGNNRNKLETTYADNMGDLTLQYTGNQNSLMEKISAAKAQAEAQVLEYNARMAAAAATSRGYRNTTARESSTEDKSLKGQLKKAFYENGGGEAGRRSAIALLGRFEAARDVDDMQAGILFNFVNSLR